MSRATTRALLKRRSYLDSLTLMSITTKANESAEIDRAFVAMGTEANKQVLRNLDLLVDVLVDAGAADLMIVVSGSSETAADLGLSHVEDLLTRSPRAATGTRDALEARSLGQALRARPETNVVLIAVNGAFAVREAAQALARDRHVLLFSDNIPVADEVSLKHEAHRRGLLMMGPDCGTARINGVALGFGNEVRPGSIGIVAASGTGAQEISVRAHEFGGGISHIIGTGGRDLTDAVGGVTALDGIRALDADPATDVVVVVSNPPGAHVARQVAEVAKTVTKPVVLCFIGHTGEADDSNVSFTAATKPAALRAVALAGVDTSTLDLHPLNWPLIHAVRAKLGPNQKFIRGLFCGGTLCEETVVAVSQAHEDVYSNIHKDADRRIDGRSASRSHTFIDFGDDAFTDGRPHPMMDPSQRTARILDEAKDPEVGVIVLDFILGYGAHADPVGAVIPAIAQARAIAAAEGRHLEILGYVLGTDLDQPDLHQQVAQLESAGVTIASSCTNLGLLAREFVRKEDAQ